VEAKMPHYVILKHDTSACEHFDLMLEADGVLKTWSLPKAPESGLEMEVKALGDHRLAYLEYEGSVSGGRGVVARWEQGTYETERQGEAELRIRLNGEKLSGRALLEKISDAEKLWRFCFYEEKQP
jgi:hypothetical protein